MIDLNHQNEWQHRDESGMILPWYTKSFLNELVTWDLSWERVFEFGCGASTKWWRSKAYKTCGAESNREYADTLGIPHADNKESFIQNGRVWGQVFDIVVVDCDPVEWRDECIMAAVSMLTTGGRLIIDNWDQKSVWVPSDETRKLLADWPVKIYPQEGHPDWKTALFTKP